jgi:archaellum component FlaC
MSDIDYDKMAEAIAKKAKVYNLNDAEEFAKYMKTLPKDLSKYSTTLGGLTKEMLTGKKQFKDLTGELENLDEQLEKMTEDTENFNAANYQALQLKRQEIARTIDNTRMQTAAIQGIVGATKAAGAVVASFVKGGASVARALQDNQDAFSVAGTALNAEVDMYNAGAQGVAKAGQAVGDTLSKSTNPRLIGLGVAISLVSSALGSLSEGISQAKKFYIDFLVKESQKLVEAMNKSAAAGAFFAGGVSEMANQANDANLTIKQFGDVVAENASTFAASGLGVGEASRLMSKAMQTGGKTAQVELLKLGYSFQEQAGLYADVISDMRRANNPQLQNAAAVQQATMQYAENLRTIAAITGEDAKKKLEESRQLAAQTAFRIRLQELEKQQPGITNQVLQAMTTMSDVQKKAIMQQIGLGAITDQSANVMMSMSDGFRKGVQGTVDAIESGNFDLKENQRLQGRANDEFRNNLGVFKQIGQAELAGVSGVASDVSKSVSGQILNSDKIGEQAVLDAQARVEQQAKTNDILTNQFVEVAQQSQTMARELEQIARNELPRFTDAVKDAMRFIQEQIKKGGGQVTGGSGPGFFTKLGNAFSEAASEALSYGIAGASSVGLLSALAGPEAIPFGTAAGGIGGGILGLIHGAYSGYTAEADGGIISARPGGTLVKAAEVGLNEAFVPLPNGRSIPVELGDMKLAGFDELHDAIRMLNENISKLPGATTLENSNIAAEVFNSMQDMMAKQLHLQQDMVSHAKDNNDLVQKLINVTA